MTDVSGATGRGTRAHPLRRMVGRDRREEHRAATPLELLYDLACW